MPMYEYKCPKCNKTWDVIKKFDEMDEPEICEECEIEGKRQISNSTFKLKGEAWLGKSTKMMEHMS